MDFEKTNNIESVKNICDNPDGESLYFELKGGRKFDKDTKKLLAKEICAFSNTYGGVLCFHYGRDKEIEGFPLGEIDTIFKQVETWTRDCLEPKIIGIEIKQTTDRLILIKVPESKIKPHRSQIDKTYYYRHSTISQNMPEIMISSLYKSKGYLEVDIDPYIEGESIESKGHFAFFLKIKNSSNIAGSKPKLQLQFYSNIQKYIPIQKKNYINDKGGQYYDSEMELIDYHLNSNYSTSKSFSKEILYPKDILTFVCVTEDNEYLKGIEHIFIKVDCMFKECQRKTEYFLFEYNENNFRLISSTKSEKKTEIIKKTEKIFKKL